MYPDRGRIANLSAPGASPTGPARAGSSRHVRVVAWCCRRRCTCPACLHGGATVFPLFRTYRRIRLRTVLGEGRRRRAERREAVRAAAGRVEHLEAAGEVVAARLRVGVAAVPALALRVIGERLRVHRARSGAGSARVVADLVGGLEGRRVVREQRGELALVHAEVLEERVQVAQERVELDQQVAGVSRNCDEAGRPLTEASARRLCPMKNCLKFGRERLRLDLERSTAVRHRDAAACRAPAWCSRRTSRARSASRGLVDEGREGAEDALDVGGRAARSSAAPRWSSRSSRSAGCRAR